VKASNYPYDYEQDPLGAACLALARQGKAQQCFGALVVKDGEIVAMGRNRRSVAGENESLGGGVDYAIHAEQAAILDALESGVDLTDASVYVLGTVLRGAAKGKLSVRASDSDQQFSCLRCARTLAAYDVPVFIPLPSGWHRLAPEETLESATAFRLAKRERVFT
jgi:hypothetical protein